jgi:hypothetical protein
MKPTVADMELCLNNAERLIKDSKNTSVPTEAALLELAIEECSKGWMLYPKLVRDYVMEHKRLPKKYSDAINNAKNSNPEAVFQAPFESIKALAEFTSEEAIDNAFRLHRVKLEFIQRLVEVVKSSSESLVKVGTKDLLAKSLYSNMDSQTLENARKLVLNRLQSMTKEKIAKLDDIKKRAFYVDKTGSTLIDPTTVEFPIEDLRFLAFVMRQSLLTLIRQAKEYFD